jgi:branched-chain amino acid transport system permease protein
VLAVVFIQGVLIEGLRFLGDWRSLLFGALIVVVMLVRPGGMLSAPLWRPSASRRPATRPAGAADAEARHA